MTTSKQILLSLRTFVLLAIIVGGVANVQNISAIESETSTSTNGTTTSVTVSSNGTDSNSSLSSGSTSISESSSTTIDATSSSTTIDVNGTAYGVDASSTDSCIQLSALSISSLSGIFCMIIDLTDGGTLSTTGTITSDSTTIGGTSGTSDFLPSDPVPSDPVPSDPVPSDPVPSDPVPSDPVPSDPVPSDPVPSDPVPSDPVPSDPEFTLFTLNKVSSGLIASDPLNDVTLTKEQLQESNYWRFGGSAAEYFEPDAPFDYFQNSTGMFIGTQAPSSGVYAGYYAVTPSTDAALFHAVITTPYASVPSDFFQNGLYVQTDNGLINYVTCVSVTSTAGTTWHLVRTYGDINNASEFEVLWSDGSTEQPLTRDCTIITNGDNYLKLYMDGTNVYESEALDLQMPGPFLYFLEPQNSYAGEMLYGIYEDYYATTDEKISIINAPLTSERVDLVDMSGNVLESSPVVDGTSVMAIGQYTFPLDAEIKVINSDGMEIASKSASIYGGDEYSVDPNTP